MPCVTGQTAGDCITDHWLDRLDGRREPAGAHARCPLCGTGRALSITPLNGRVVWHNHCDCAREAVSQALTDLVACYTGRRQRRQHAPDHARIQALLLDKSIPPNALRVGCLLAYGMTMQAIVTELKIPKSTYYDAVRILGQHRRSEGVRQVSSPRTRTTPQVRGTANTIGEVPPLTRPSPRTRTKAQVRDTAKSPSSRTKPPLIAVRELGQKPRSETCLTVLALA